MSSYPQGEVLVARCRAGLGKIVIVEGESVDQDPWFYGRWFGDRARELTFVPQNGCEKVVQAVAELRAQLSPAREVFGIRDRDFCEDDALLAQDAAMPADGVLRPRRYTLENYLLEPEGWFEVVKVTHRSVRPPAWDSVEAVSDRVLDAYRRCLTVAAWNYTVCQEYARLPGDVNGERFKYRAHPDAMTPRAREELDAWGAARGAPGPLGDAFMAELERLGAADLAEWQRRVTGKAVLKVFKNSFPVAARDLLDNLYINLYPRPPEDLERLVRRILAAGR